MALLNSSWDSPLKKLWSKGLKIMLILTSNGDPDLAKSRKYSRTQRLSLLRTTAFPTLRLAVVPYSMLPSLFEKFKSSHLVGETLFPFFLRERKSELRLRATAELLSTCRNRQALAAFSTAARDHILTGFRSHSCTETMSAFATAIARLVCTFHFRLL